MYFTQLPFEGLPTPNMGTAIFDNQKNLVGLYTNVNGDLYLPFKNEPSSTIKNIILAAEDRSFFQHQGVDFLAILRACFQNIFSGRRVSGASTITMQFIRLQTNYPRNWSSKIKEAWYAQKLERYYSKDQILKAYLNNAPFGSNVYGLETASLFYFSKSTEFLSLEELALLLGLPQAPSRLRPDRYLVKANNRKNVILNRMIQNHTLKKDIANHYLSQPIQLNIHANGNNKLTIPLAIKTSMGKGEVYSSLDYQIQNNVSKITEEFFSIGSIENCCAVSVIEVATGKIVALFERGDQNSYVSCATSQRSSGSCLKPFIYCQAFDLGLAWPEQIVSDEMLSFSGYQPKNNDNQNFKRIAIEDALRLSRNVPAVELRNKIGLNKFEEKMVSLSLLSSDNTTNSGLSSAIGGISVNLLALTNAYTVFARDGNFKQYTWLLNEKKSQTNRLFTSNSVNRMKQCLIHNESLHFYAKTGTSWGPRDAWCIGYNEKYSVGVWIGKKEGGTMNLTTGESTAYPLLCRIFSVLTNDVSNEKCNNSTVLICNESGSRASIYCQNARLIKQKDSLILPPLCVIHLKEQTEQKVNKFCILSPQNHGNYILIEKNNRLSIECKSNQNNQASYWFVNGLFKGYFSQYILYADDLKGGENVVAAINYKGDTDSVGFIVAFAN